MIDWLEFAAGRVPGLWLRTGEHIMLTGASTLAAIVLGVPLGIAAHRLRWLRGTITGMVGILQTIPSLAMLAFLLALLNRIGAVPAIIALVLYALLPIVRNTLAGLGQVPPAIAEAADGIGMTARQRLWWVELPLAAPVIVTGIRTAAVVGVGIATLSAFIGAGGLGQFINRGLSLSNNNLILLGAVPSALLALLVDASIGAVQWGMRRRRGKSRLPRAIVRPLRVAAVCAPAVILAVGALAVARPDLLSSRGGAAAASGVPVIRVGSKNFTEQLILGELMAQLIENDGRLRVIRTFDLGGTMICHQALVDGQIDLYAEYTGTALTAVLERPAIADPQAAYDAVSAAYARRFDLRWLESFGFNNTYAITIRADDAKRWHVETISDLAKLDLGLRAGWTAEFSERPDGFPGLKERYGLHFSRVRDLDTSLMYSAIDQGQVDVICAFSTDGRIAAYHLQPLRDDLRFFPPYFAAPVVRQEMIDEHPELPRILNRLAGKLTTPVMQKLNSQVDQDKLAPADVARAFLETAIFRSNSTESFSRTRRIGGFLPADLSAHRAVPLLPQRAAVPVAEFTSGINPLVR